jgi:ethanolamine transporter EutH
MAVDKSTVNALLVAMDMGDYRKARALAADVQQASDASALASRVKVATEVDGRALVAAGVVLAAVAGLVLQAMAH